MIIRYLSEKHKESWENLVRSTPESGFMQSWMWSNFKEAEGQKVLRIGIFDNDELIAGTIAYYVPSSLGASPLELPYGPVLPWGNEKKASACAQLLKQELAVVANDIGAPAARLEPFMVNRLPDYMGQTIRAPIDLIPTPTLMIPINESDEKILSNMAAKGRYNVRLALRKGVEVFHTDKESDVEDFYSLFELTFTRHNFQGEPRSFFENMMKYLGLSGMARMYFARYKGVLVSSSIAIFYGERATYLYGGSLPFLRSSMANYALHWKMIVDGRSKGCRFYDMYGIAPAGKPFHPYARFSEFKSRFGGSVVTTVGAHDIYFYPQLANMWIKSVESAEREIVIKCAK